MLTYLLPCCDLPYVATCSTRTDNTTSAFHTMNDIVMVDMVAWWNSIWFLWSIPPNPPKWYSSWWFQPIWKNMIVKLELSPGRDENKKMKPPKWYDIFWKPDRLILWRQQRKSVKNHSTREFSNPWHDDFKFVFRAVEPWYDFHCHRNPCMLYLSLFIYIDHKHQANIGSLSIP